MTIVERQAFPRPKVCGCCLGGAGLSALAQLGVRDELIALGVQLHRWSGTIDRRPVSLMLPGGLAISREQFDSRLLAEARRCGASIVQPATAQIAASHQDAVEVELKTAESSRSERFGAVVVAGGLNAGNAIGATGRNLLPWTEPPHGPFGAMTFSPPDSELSNRLDMGVVYMACDWDGYAGLVRLEDGRTDIAAALHSGRAETQRSGRSGTLTPAGRITGILDRAGLPSPNLSPQDEVFTTGPLRRTRQAGAGRVIAVGDAAGYVEPFTGEGMTWGMQSGIAAADHIHRRLAALECVGEHWDQQLGKLLRRRKRHCRWVASTLANPVGRRLIRFSLVRCPGLARPLLNELQARGTTD